MPNYLPPFWVCDIICNGSMRHFETLFQVSFVIIFVIIWSTFTVKPCREISMYLKKVFWLFFKFFYFYFIFWEPLVYWWSEVHFMLNTCNVLQEEIQIPIVIIRSIVPCVQMNLKNVLWFSVFLLFLLFRILFVTIGVLMIGDYTVCLIHETGRKKEIQIPIVIIRSTFTIILRLQMYLKNLPRLSVFFIFLLF